MLKLRIGGVRLRSMKNTAVRGGEGPGRGMQRPFTAAALLAAVGQQGRAQCGHGRGQAGGGIQRPSPVFRPGAVPSAPVMGIQEV